ncbi:MAG: 7-cyano-7-deazaguanine synthase, partial [Thermoplasmata archaeon]|nr:7-cyano-7-deazaguanine synthase [Thermoplasmata archaeon]
GQTFIDAFKNVIKVGTKSGVEGHPIDILVPIASMSKSDIVKKGMELGVPFKLTWSCYKGGGKPCGKCESCMLRKKGFAQAGVEDPALVEEPPKARKK